MEGMTERTMECFDFEAINEQDEITGNVLDIRSYPKYKLDGLPRHTQGSWNIQTVLTPDWNGLPRETCIRRQHGNTIKPTLKHKTPRDD